jgi:hypothetical protein
VAPGFYADIVAVEGDPQSAMTERFGGGNVGGALQ